jgi:hypothetical protein
VERGFEHEDEHAALVEWYRQEERGILGGKKKSLGAISSTIPLTWTGQGSKSDRRGWLLESN